MLKIKAIFTWRQCKVFLINSAHIEDEFVHFVKGSSDEMLVCECKTAKLAEEVANSLNKKLTKWDKISSLMKD